MAYTLSIEDVLIYAVCSRRYITQQSKLFVDSDGKKGLPCNVKAIVGGETIFVDGEKFLNGGRNIYEYDPIDVAKWLARRSARYKQERANYLAAEQLTGAMAEEMEGIARGS